jgi:maltose alpha-D-glucosyltransferase/alpha-amylase
VLETANQRVLVFLRRYHEDTILCVNNLSRYAQVAEFDLSEFNGMFPLELWSKCTFPPVGDRPYLLTLGPHDVFWFRIITSEQAKPYQHTP